MSERAVVTPSAAPRFARNVIVLGLVSFFADVSSEMVYPIVPLFLTSSLGAPAIAVGLIEGVAESTASIVKLVSGWLSDRYRRRAPFTLAGYAFSAVAKPALAAAFVWPLVLVVRFVDRVGKGVRVAPRDALIAASTPVDARGAAFGLHRAMDTLGAVAGPLIALLLLGTVGDTYRLIFLLAFIPGAIGAVLVLAVREPAAGDARAEAPPALSLRGYDARFLVFLGATFIFALGNSSDAFLILRARDLGLSATAAVLAYVVYNVVYASVSLPAGLRSDRIGRLPVLVAGFGVFASVYAGLALAGAGWAVWPLFAVYGVYIAMTDGVGKAYVSDLVPEDRRATALGLYNATVGVTVLLASVMGGALWDVVGPAATFAFGAATAAIAAVVLALSSRLRA
jgi:MFS family permease